MTRQLAERDRIEQALRRSEQFIRKVLESTGDSIQVLDLDGRLLTDNAAGRAAFFPASEDLPSQDWVELWPVAIQPVARRSLEEARQGRAGHFQGPRDDAQGCTHWWDVIVTPMLDDEHRPAQFVAVCRDITERRLTEEHLRQSAKMEAIGRLAAGLAHDFNNHLHVLGGLATFVSRDPGLSPRSQDDLMDLRAAVEHMSALTRQLLAFSRQQVLTLETLDLNVLLLEMEPLVRRLLGEQVEIELRVAETPLWILADRSQVLQILMNLTINGRDAMPDGGRLEIESSRVPGPPANGECREYVELLVRDSGQGIPADHMPHLFEPFYTTKPPGKGTGLGLATVHGIVTQGGGHLEVTSVPGEGAAFMVRFLPAPVPTPATTEAEPCRGVRRLRARVLVAQEEDALRLILARTLEAAGYEVLQERTGEATVETLRRVGLVHLILADVGLEGMSGAELDQRLAQEFPDTGVIWVSGHLGNPEFLQRAAVRRQPILQKPVPADLLLTAVGRALAAPGTIRIVP